MSRNVAFAYPGARAQARFGQLLADGQWQRLSRVPDLALFVQTARETALRPWVQQLDPAAGPHQIEAHLRGQFRSRVRAVAGWAPRDWRAALLWTAVLPDLPALAHAQAGREPLAWMAGDADLRKPPASPLPPRAWLERWRRLWPSVGRDEREPLDALARVLERAARQGASADLATLEPSVRAPLRRLFRRATRSPAGLFAYLALLWLEFVKLRGAVLRRRLALPLEENPA